MNGRFLTCEGRQLCSSRDPAKEARAWCDHVLGTELTVHEHYWVVGLGAGFHIEELARRRPQSVLSVLDHREHLVAGFADWGRALQGQVLVEQVQNFESLFTTMSFQIYGLKHSPVFEFLPSIQGSELWAREIQAGLQGRSHQGFKKFVELMHLSSLYGNEKIDQQKELSIKTIELLICGAPPSQDKKIFSLLRELVR